MKKQAMDKIQEEIKAYYDKLAKDYDNNRFANSYGQYIHQQELAVLSQYLLPTAGQLNVDIACGTGRFLSYANYGVDISAEMLAQARKKYPEKTFVNAKIGELPFQDNFFDNATCFHLFMHLNEELLTEALGEVHRVLKKGGYFIFDVPSEQRRKLLGYHKTSWHGANQISVHRLRDLLGEDWDLLAYKGVAFLPIHRLPKSLRKLFIPLDNLLSRSPLRAYSSHIIYILRKR